MQFQVPQFIEVEDKIFGPLTFKQFIYVLGGLGAAYLEYRALSFYLALPLMLASAGFGLALAFMEYNGRPFILALENGFYYLLHPKLYLWNNEQKTAAPVTSAAIAAAAADASALYVPKLSESKLHELAWSLDITERIQSGTISDRERSEAENRFAGLIAPVRTAWESLVSSE